MRSLVLLLMVALLPLRMWAAEDMAVRMAQADLAVAASASMQVSAMPEDCPMMAKADAGTPHEAVMPMGGEESAGGHCFACYLGAAAAASSALPTGAVARPAGPPERSSSRFASAELAPDLRPPIA